MPAAQLVAGSRPVTLSRWQLNLFSECPRCFWLVNRCGIKLPKALPFALNNAIDRLLKAEFDQAPPHRNPAADLRLANRPGQALPRHIAAGTLAQQLSGRALDRAPFRAHSLWRD